MLALAALFGLGRERVCGLIRAVEEVYIRELAAGGDKALRRFLLAHAEHKDFGFAESRREARKVGVRGDNAEAVKTPLIEQVHGIDDEGGVRGVLAGYIGVLLYGLHGVVEYHIAPASHLWRGPVPVNALDVDTAEIIGLGEHDGQILRCDVFGINQHGDTALPLLIVHANILSLLT